MNSNLEGNIIKYNLLKIFTKRVYLPLIVVFLTTIGGVTLKQLAIIASVTGLTSLVLEVPTGYLSDRWGHKKALLFGSAISALSVLFYIFIPNFIGGLLASVVFFAGASFSSGTTQAFIHETLMALGKEKEYVKIMGKAQGYGLVGNIFLISLIPLTYQINPKIPFVLGFICLLIGFFITASFVEPPARVAVKDNLIKSIKILKESLPKKLLIRLLVVFVIFGIASSSFDSSIIYREIIFKNIGVPVQYFGFILAIGSFFAAITSRYIHHLKNLSPFNFYLFDTCYVASVFILVGITKNIFIVILAFTLLAAYDRTRGIIFESHLFEEFSDSSQKATVVSIMNFFPLLFFIIVPLILGFLVNKTNIHIGYSLFGLTLLVILLPILFLYNYLCLNKKA